MSVTSVKLPPQALVALLPCYPGLSLVCLCQLSCANCAGRATISCPETGFSHLLRPILLHAPCLARFLLLLLLLFHNLPAREPARFLLSFVTDPPRPPPETQNSLPFVLPS